MREWINLFEDDASDEIESDRLTAQYAREAHVTKLLTVACHKANIELSSDTQYPVSYNEEDDRLVHISVDDEISLEQLSIFKQYGSNISVKGNFSSFGGLIIQFNVSPLYIQEDLELRDVPPAIVPAQRANNAKLLDTDHVFHNGTRIGFLNYPAAPFLATDKNIYAHHSPTNKNKNFSTINGEKTAAAAATQWLKDTHDYHTKWGFNDAY